MRGLKVHPIYSQDATVYIETGDDQLRTMQRAIDDSGFLDTLETVYAASKKTRSDFLIAIKPNIMTASIRQEHSPIYTDPVLVEYLIARIRERGFENVAVCEARNVYDYSYKGRTVRAVAQLVGYSGEGYRIADLS